MAKYKGTTRTSDKLFKEFFKFYYAHRYKGIMTASLIAGIIIAASGALIVYDGWMLAGAIMVWAGLMLIIYPKTLYKRPYKKMKNQVYGVKFEFEEEYMIETQNHASQKYNYSDLYRVYDTGKYFYFLETKTDASVLAKDDVSDPQGLASFLEQKLSEKYKKA